MDDLLHVTDGSRHIHITRLQANLLQAKMTKSFKGTTWLQTAYKIYVWSIRKNVNTQLIVTSDEFTFLQEEYQNLK
jgi:hypothetical protein